MISAAALVRLAVTCFVAASAFVPIRQSPWLTNGVMRNSPTFDSNGQRLDVHGVVLELNTMEALDHLVATKAGGPLANKGASLENNQQHKLIMLKAYGEGCKKCAAVAPKFIEFAEKHSEVLCCAINLSKVKGAFRALNVSSVPLFIVYSDGERTDELQASTLDAFENYVEDFCEDECAVDESWQ